MAARGRLAYPDIDKLEQKIEEYFAPFEIAENCEPASELGEEVGSSPPRRIPGISGLASHLGVDRRSLLRWSNDTSDRRSWLIEMAKTRVEEALETALYDRRTYRGAAMSLAANFGWRRDSASSSGQSSGGEFRINLVEPPVRNGKAVKFEPY